MIRPITPDDTATTLITLAGAIGFEPNELEQLGQMFADYFDSNLENHHFCITDDDSEPVGVAYFAPEPMTDHTWNLYTSKSHFPGYLSTIVDKMCRYSRPSCE